MNNGTKSFFFLVGALMMAFVWSISSYQQGHSSGGDEQKREAVKAGAAHYVADADTGVPKFEWKTAK